MHSNFLAIIVAAVAAIAIGFLWYGPLFGKQWIRMMGWSSEHRDAARKKGMTGQLIIQVIGSLVMAFVLSHAVLDLGLVHHYSGVFLGLYAGFWNWLGFIAPVTVGMVLWEGKPWKLWLLNSGCWVLTLLVMGVILAVW
jgi:hypothetical protein